MPKQRGTYHKTHAEKAPTIILLSSDIASTAIIIFAKIAIITIERLSFPVLVLVNSSSSDTYCTVYYCCSCCEKSPACNPPREFVA